MKAVCFDVMQDIVLCKLFFFFFLQQWGKISRSTLFLSKCNHIFLNTSVHLDISYKKVLLSRLLTSRNYYFARYLNFNSSYERRAIYTLERNTRYNKFQRPKCLFQRGLQSQRTSTQKSIIIVVFMSLFPMKYHADTCYIIPI